MRWLILAVCCLTPAALSGAQTASPPTIEQQIRSILAAHKVPESDCGIVAVPMKTGVPLAAINADKPLIVASNRKLFTTAAALDALGPGYEFVTRVCRSGPVEGGVLKGDIVIIGGGDPSISGRFYGGDALAVPRQWAEAIRAAGITSIEGNVVADDLIFDREFVHPTWPQAQLDKWYCAPVAGLAYNDDCIDITVAPGKADGAPANVALSPATKYVMLQNECKTTTDRRKHVIGFGRIAGSRTIRVWGQCWFKAQPWTDSISVDNPPLLLATVLQEQLAACGVKVSGGALLADAPARPDKLTEICRTTHDLASAVVVANKRSQNFYAEQLHKLTGRVVEGDGSFAGGGRALARFLTRLGIKPGEYASADGSGMSRDNQFTTRQVATLLIYMTDHPASAAFIDSLPIAGEDGTLSGRFQDPAVRGRIRAKTGYLSQVHALSGYVTDDLGKPLWVFSILINGRKGNPRGVQEDVCGLLAKLSRPAAAKP